MCHPLKSCRFITVFVKLQLMSYLQQEQVLTELYSHIHQDPPPADVEAVVETHRFLQACNLLFERGFLSHEKVNCMNSNVLQNISNGYQYLHLASRHC